MDIIFYTFYARIMGSQILCPLIILLPLLSLAAVGEKCIEESPL